MARAGSGFSRTGQDLLDDIEKRQRAEAVRGIRRDRPAAAAPAPAQPLSEIFRRQKLKGSIKPRERRELQEQVDREQSIVTQEQQKQAVAAQGQLEFERQQALKRTEFVEPVKARQAGELATQQTKSLGEEVVSAQNAASAELISREVNAKDLEKQKSEQIIQAGHDAATLAEASIKSLADVRVANINKEVSEMESIDKAKNLIHVEKMNTMNNKHALLFQKMGHQHTILQEQEKRGPLTPEQQTQKQILEIGINLQTAFAQAIDATDDIDQAENMRLQSNNLMDLMGQVQEKFFKNPEQVDEPGDEQEATPGALSLAQLAQTDDTSTTAAPDDLAGLDEDGDGILSPQELAQGRAKMAALTKVIVNNRFPDNAAQFPGQEPTEDQLKKIRSQINDLNKHLPTVVKKFQ